ncbi:MAG: bifunctional sugar-1-phosphate nucleotidylyltransferase/acetyltransferase [Minisyncoccales bacterium]|jgi:UDP-N-acetylglucosamine diphosphorylase/glucosamine-1-phosphate N-acetyltransferase
MLKAVIIAAGNGVRMQPLTFERPKPLLRIVDKTILEHNLDQLQGVVKEVIIVIGYRGEMIKQRIGDKYGKIRVRYVVQEDQLGTGDAAQKAAQLIDDKFILLNGDDLYLKEDIKATIKKHPSILLGRVKNPSSFGVVECYDNFVKNITEKPENPPAEALVNTGLYFLDKSIFSFAIGKSPRGEVEFTDYIKALITQERLYFKTTSNWIPISYPWNFLEANRLMVGKESKSIKGNIEKNCVIIGNVRIEKGALIKSGTRIEGPVYIGEDTIIGPNAFIREKTIIGRDCRVGAGVEVKASVIGDKTNLPHLTYIGDSVIGDRVNIGGGTILANFRFDKKNIKVNVKGERVDTGFNKLGAIIGDGVSVGINCSIMPGTVIGNDSIIGPGSIVKGDVEKEVILRSQFN